MRLHVTRQGEDVGSLQPYLGSYVVVTCFRHGDNALMRTVPVEAPESARSLGGPKLTLKPVFPASGELPHVPGVPDVRPDPDGVASRCTRPDPASEPTTAASPA